jgi:hypothetical protein
VQASASTSWSLSLEVVRSIPNRAEGGAKAGSTGPVLAPVSNPSEGLANTSKGHRIRFHKGACRNYAHQDDGKDQGD